jgi:glutaconate CoA-transferase subunit A
LHRFRDAVENAWPLPLELVEMSHAMMATAYVAGASGLPFGILRGGTGTDLPGVSPALRWVRCPFTEVRLLAVEALRPDVTVIHAQRADRQGNVQFWGILGVQKEAALAAGRVIVTVEEVVERLEPRPGAVVLPHFTVTAVCAAPGGAHPSYADGYDQRDNAFYQAWDGVSRERQTFLDWIERHVLGTADVEGYRRSLSDRAAESA